MAAGSSDLYGDFLALSLQNSTICCKEFGNTRQRLALTVLIDFLSMARPDAGTHAM